jgi:aldehyde:ferredoxin oxidoreductase
MWKCREVCQRYGMDQIGPIPFAMELFQRGIITKEDTGGLRLEWGNESDITEMLRKIAYREGLGDILAEGSVRAAKKIGTGADKCVKTVKGLELLCLDPRMNPPAMNLGYLVSPRGDDLNTTHAIYETFPEWARRAGWSKEKYARWFVDWVDMFEDIKKRVFGTLDPLDAFEVNNVEEKAALTKWYGELSSVFNSLGLCLFAVNCFSAIGPTHLAKLYSSGTGWPMTPAEIMKAGERIFNLMKAFAVREGFTRKDDEWPAIFYEESLPEGPAKGAILTREKISLLLDQYYELMGWDKASGEPTQERLVELGLEDVAEELKNKRSA